MISLEKINQLESACASMALNPPVAKQKMNNIIADILCDIEEDPQLANLLLETLLEKNVTNECIAQIFHFTKEHVKDNENLFKWACAFRHPELIQLFFDNLNIKPEDAAINASIINFKLENLIYLEMLGFDIYKEKHFSQAISRSYQPRQINFIHYYIRNEDKFPKNELTDYTLKQLSEHDFVLDSAFTIGSFKVIDFFLKNPILKEAFSNQIKNNVENWFHSSIKQKEPKLLLKLLELSTEYPLILNSFQKISQDLLVTAFREDNIKNILCLLNIEKNLSPEVLNSTKKSIKAPKVNAQCLAGFINGNELDNLKSFLESKNYQQYVDKKIDYEYLLTRSIEEDKLEIFDYLNKLDKNPFNLNNKESQNNKIELFKLVVLTMKYEIEEDSQNNEWLIYMITEQNTPLTKDLEQYLKEQLNLESSKNIIKQFKLKELKDNLTNDLENINGKTKGVKI